MIGTRSSDGVTLLRTILLATAVLVAGFAFAAAPAAATATATDAGGDGPQFDTDGVDCEGCPCPLDGKLGDCPQSFDGERLTATATVDTAAPGEDTDCVDIECQVECVVRTVTNPKDPTCPA